MKTGEGNAITGLLEAAINRYLAEDPANARTLTELEDKLIELQLQNLNMSVFMRILQGQILLSVNDPAEPDTCLSGSPLTLARFFLAKQVPDTSIVITGNTVPAETLRTLLSGIDIDWEEHLSRIVGDVAAHRIGRQFKHMPQDTAKKSSAFVDDVSNYLQEETRLLVHPIELQDFKVNVNRLSDEVDQAAMRIDRLATILGRSQT